MFLESVWQDIRYAFRALRQSPGFVCVAVLSLSLGVCIATCAISEMNGMVLRELPGVAQPEQLVALQAPSSFPYYRSYSQLNEVFSSVTAYVAPVPITISAELPNSSSMTSWGSFRSARTRTVLSSIGGMVQDGTLRSLNHQTVLEVVSHGDWIASEDLSICSMKLAMSQHGTLRI